MAPIFSPSLLFIIQFMIVTTQSILFIIASTTSFTLPLIPPLSPESPFYQVNLTQHQQLNHIISQTDHYYLNSQSFKTSANKFHLPVINIPPSLFVTKLVLGTPAVTQVLVIDTGSGTTWTQCKKCFDQTPVPLFNPDHSSSYHNVPCSPACIPPYECVAGVCKYLIRYADGGSSNGSVARETFTIGNQHVEMMFGCGEDIREIKIAGRGISGIVGLNTFRYSLVNQLVSPHHRRFSYCFVSGLNRSGLLKIGKDATIRGSGVNTVDFVRQEIKAHYYLNLIDISVGSKMMRFPRGTFEFHSDGTGGCFIDSGTVATYLDEVPYNKVTAEFDQYFKSQGLRRFNSSKLEYCYGYDHRHFKKFIKMTFHFDRWVDYVVETPNMYVMVPEQGYFCVVLKKAKGRNILGAWQQMNKRIVYDLDNKKLHFKHEDCARDAH